MNTANLNTIDHEGIIDHVEGEVARVRIISQSACASCHAKGVCGASDQKEKFLDVPLNGMALRNGEKVKVLVARRLGMKAVALGYVYPFILVMVLLFVLSSAGLGELRSGLTAIASLVPYYLVLYFARKRVESKFTFSIQKT
jgi:sigma-E factor negative regulatory protein RseC